MQVTQSNFDCETVALMGRVCDDAWRDLQVTMFFPLPSDANEILHRIAPASWRRWLRGNVIPRA